MYWSMKWEEWLNTLGGAHWNSLRTTKKPISITRESKTSLENSSRNLGAQSRMHERDGRGVASSEQLVAVVSTSGEQRRGCRRGWVRQRTMRAEAHTWRAELSLRRTTMKMVGNDYCSNNSVEELEKDEWPRSTEKQRMAQIWITRRLLLAVRWTVRQVQLDHSASYTHRTVVLVLSGAHVRPSGDYSPDGYSMQSGEASPKSWFGFSTLSNVFSAKTK
jgi:hypothetical protein